MSDSPINNYAIQCERARAQFLTYDQAAMCARLGLEMTEDAIPIRFLGEMCTIRRADGAVAGEVKSFYPGIGEWESRDPHRDWILPPYSPIRV